MLSIPRSNESSGNNSTGNKSVNSNNNKEKKKGNNKKLIIIYYKKARRLIKKIIRALSIAIVKTQWVNWFHLVLLPVVTLVYIFTYNVMLNRFTTIFAVLTFIFTQFSINIGFHRYFTHKSFEINSTFLKYFLVLLASCTGFDLLNFQINHLQHHRYCDTNKDPHNYRKNFFWAHIGWKLFKSRQVVQLFDQSKMKFLEENQFPKHKLGESLENSDLDTDFDERQHKSSDNDDFLNRKYDDLMISLWQSSYCSLFYLSLGLIMPSIICGYFIDNGRDGYISGLLYAGVLKNALNQQVCFLSNSLGHSLGRKTFDTSLTCRDSGFVNLLTFGEGYNSFHKRFPNEYRGTPSPFVYDPIKWILQILKNLGLVSNLKCASDTLISQLIILEKQKVLDRKRRKLNWGIPTNKLPMITPEHFNELVKRSPEKALIIIDGIVHDVSPFLHNHPGGEVLLTNSIGKNATAAFEGLVYKHSNAARNLLATMRVAVLRDSSNKNGVHIAIKQDTANNSIGDMTLDTADAA